MKTIKALALALVLSAAPTLAMDSMDRDLADALKPEEASVTKVVTGAGESTEETTKEVAKSFTDKVKSFATNTKVTVTQKAKDSFSAAKTFCSDKKESLGEYWAVDKKNKAIVVVAATAAVTGLATAVYAAYAKYQANKEENELLENC